jgi:hypothetical protein
MVGGLAAIAKVTGLSFNQVSADDDRAAIHYAVGDTQQDNAMGLASTDGNVTLLDASWMPDAGDDALNKGFRDRVVAHETLHALGLDHDSDVGSGRPDELMNPSQPWAPLKFGKGDVTGMKYIRDTNECSPPAPGSPAPVPTVDPTIANDPVAIMQVTSGDSHQAAVTMVTIASGSGCAAVDVRSVDGTAQTCTPARHDDSVATKPTKGGASTPTTTVPPKRGDSTPATSTPTKPAKGDDSRPTTQTPPKRGDSTPATQTPPRREETQTPPRRETPAVAPAPAPAPAAPAAPAPAPAAPRRESSAPAPAAPVVAAPAPAAPVVAAPAPAPAPAASAPRRESSGDRGHRDRD